MGAWSHEPFGNDDAVDWIADLEASNDLSLIETAFDAIAVSENTYVESPECCNALAAAEVVAAMHGKPSQYLPSTASAWAANHPQPSQALISQGRAAVERIMKSSELQELWAETDDYAAWQQETQSLLKRLG